jgi:hypothetical protein
MTNEELFSDIKQLIQAEIGGVHAEIDGLRGEINERFAEVDRRFEAIDRRFEIIDRRFDDSDLKQDEILDAIGATLHQLDTKADDHERRIRRLESSPA